MRAAPSITRPAIAAIVATLLCALAAQSPVLAKDRGERIGPPPVAGHRPPPPVPRGQWWDGAHGHGRAYPVTGWHVHSLPPRVAWVPWGGVRYAYWNGVWYSPYGAGFVVARPPVGILVHDLPPFRTVVTIGGIGYLYANGVYYRELPDGAYQVVPSPIVAATDGAAPRMYVYPKQGQSPERQASDEYECHRWAVGQTGFDPSTQATGQAVSTGTRGDYARAQTACLEGRGYTVR
jgi:hypothetical protein